MTELEHIELAKEIAAARRGEAGMPFEDWQRANITRLRAAVDSIRTRRSEWRAPEKKTRVAKDPSAPKATVEKMGWDELGLGGL